MSTIHLADDFFVPPADELVGVDDGGGYIEGALGGLFDDEPPTEHAASEPPSESATAEQREEANHSPAKIAALIDRAIVEKDWNVGEADEGGFVTPPKGHPAAAPSPEINADPHTPAAWQVHVQDHLAWEDRHRDAEHNLCVVALELSAAQERVKSLREALKELTEILASVQREEPKWQEKMAAALSAPRPVSTIVPAAASASAPTATDTDPSAEQAALADDLANPDPNAWRSVPINQLKLKPSIEAKLLESGISTIGQLEDLRADGGAGGAGKNGLRSIKGVGQAKADAIEDAVIAWLSANRDEGIFKGKDFCGPPISDPEEDDGSAGHWTAICDQAEAAEVVAPATTEDPPATLPYPSLSCSSTPAGILANDPDAQCAAAIEDRASELIHQQRSAEEAADGEEPLEPQCDTDRWWAGGVEAFDRGDRLIDCPIEPVGGAECDDWLRGWLTAKLDDEERQKAVGDAS